VLSSNLTIARQNFTLLSRLAEIKLSLELFLNLYLAPVQVFALLEVTIDERKGRDVISAK
jgi:hypothetical protein